MPYLVGYITPQDYGALGNGSNDDTSAFQSAINAVAAQAGGGTLFVPPGTYKLSSALAGASEVSILGVGQSSILSQSSTTANVLTYAATTLVNISIQGLMIQGPSSGSGIGISMSANSGSNPVVNTTISNVVVKGMGSHGISIATPITSNFTTVECVNNGGAGFITTNGTSVAFDNCYMNGNTSYGFEVTTLSYSSLNGCASDSNTTAYYLNGCNNLTLASCGAESNSANGFLVNGGTGNSLVSCYINVNNAVGAWFTGSSTAGFIQGFREVGPTGSATASIQVDSGCTVTVGSSTIVTATNLNSGAATIITGAEVYVSGNAGTASAQVNRAATTNFATYQVLTNGVEQWLVGLTNNSTNDLWLEDGVNSKAVLIAEQHTAQPNIQLLSNTKSFGSGVGVIGLADASTVPTTSPTGGLVAYSASATATPVKIRDTSGNVRSLADGYFQLTTSPTFTLAAQTATTVLLAVEASATYLMEAALIISNTTGTTTPSWTGPTSATMQWCDTTASTDYSSTIGATNNSYPSSASTRMIFLKGLLVVSTTAGSLTLTLGVSAGTTTLGAGTTLRLTRVK